MSATRPLAISQSEPQLRASPHPVAEGGVAACPDIRQGWCSCTPHSPAAQLERGLKPPLRAQVLAPVDGLIGAAGSLQASSPSRSLRYAGRSVVHMSTPMAVNSDTHVLKVMPSLPTPEVRSPHGSRTFGGGFSTSIASVNTLPINFISLSDSASAVAAIDAARPKKRVLKGADPLLSRSPSRAAARVFAGLPTSPPKTSKPQSSLESGGNISPSKWMPKQSWSEVEANDTLTPAAHSPLLPIRSPRRSPVSPKRSPVSPKRSPILRKRHEPGSCQHHSPNEVMQAGEGAKGRPRTLTEPRTLATAVRNAISRANGPNKWQRILFLSSFHALLRRQEGVRQLTNRTFGGVTLPFKDRLRMLRQLKFLSKLEDEELVLLAQQSSVVLLPRYACVQRGDRLPVALYVVVAGSLIATDEHGGTGVLGPGASFGEMALAPTMLRWCYQKEVVSSKTSLLLKVERSKLEKTSFYAKVLEAAAAHIMYEAKKQVVQRMHIFLPSGSSLHMRILPMLTLWDALAGTLVYSENEPANSIFMLARGVIQLRRIQPAQDAAVGLPALNAPPSAVADNERQASTRRRRSSRKLSTLAESKHLLTLRHDDSVPWFGEAALFGDDVRRLHDASCVEDCQLVVIAREHFEEFKRVIPSLVVLLHESSIALDSHTSKEASWQELCGVSRALAANAIKRYEKQEAIMHARWRRDQHHMNPQADSVWSRIKEHSSDIIHAKRSLF